MRYPARVPGMPGIDGQPIAAGGRRGRIVVAPSREACG